MNPDDMTQKGSTPPDNLPGGTPHENSDAVPKKSAEPISNEDLNAEGIEIVGSSMALDNEFMKPEAHGDQKNEEEVKTTIDLDKDDSLPGDNIASPIPPIAPEKPKPVSEPKSFVKTPEPLQTTPQKPPEIKRPITEAAQKTPETPVQNTKNDPSIKPLRTFKTDAEEAVRYSNMSKINIAVAEQKKKDKTPIEYEKEKHASPGLYILIVVVIIGLLGGGWYFWFTTSQKTQEVATTAPVFSGKTIIPYGKAGIVVMGDDPMTEISEKLAQGSAGVGNIYALIPVDSASSATPSPISTVFAKSHIPDRLLRSLSNEYMLGVYSYDVQSPFVILKNTYYQNAYSGMLSWENDLGNDLYSLIHIAHPNETPASVNISSWGDAVISNIDIRELKNGTGDPLLLYAFADKDTIVIATTENSLKFLLDRILQVRTIQ